MPTFNSKTLRLDQQKAVKEYKTIGKILNSSPNNSSLSAIQDVIDKITRPILDRDLDSDSNIIDEHGVPFIAVVGPSLMGKTQLAFTLAETQPVLYFNFPPLEQKVCSSFSEISLEMLSCIRSDLSVLTRETGTSFVGVEFLLQTFGISSIPLKSLGFLFALIEKSLAFDFEAKNNFWIDEYLNIKDLFYAEMGIIEFHQKFNKLLKERILVKKIIFPVIFIDEFQKVNEIIFLRSLTRSIGLPCILASSNSQVSNMLSSGLTKTRLSRKIFCHIVSVIPSAKVEGLLEIIDVIDEEPLKLFIDPSGYIKFKEFESKLDIKFSDEERVLIQNIVYLIVSQSDTCHQGMVGLAFSKLIEILKNIKEIRINNLNIFNLLISKLTKELIMIKAPLVSNDCLFFSILTFSRFPQLYDVKEHAEGVATQAIHGHFYHFGEKVNKMNQPIGVLELEKVGDVLKNNGLIFFVKSHFSNFKENILMHMAIWNIFSTKLCGNNFGAETIARIVKTAYDKTSDYWMNVEALSNNSNTQEFMTNFAMAHASHQCFPELTDGITLLKEFAIQVQISNTFLDNFSGLLRDLIVNVPVRLETFLKEIKIPYLIPQLPEDSRILDPLKKIMKIGVCKRLRNIEGFDISFDLADGSEGRVECKNQDDPVTRQTIRKYLIRAINSKRKLTIFLANKVGPSLKSHEEFNKFLISTRKEVSKVDKLTKKLKSIMSLRKGGKKRKPVARESYSETISRAIKSGDLKVKSFNLNIYSLTFDPANPSAVKSVMDLKFKTLHESTTDKADGVFIILESNCSFSPKLNNLKVAPVEPVDFELEEEFEFVDIETDNE